MIGIAKTPPPVDNYTSLFATKFDPDFDYLESGGGYISYVGNQKVLISGETMGTVHVDMIGVQITLQRWTGTAWVDVYSTPNVVSSQSAYVYKDAVVGVSEGYYYRVKTTHWTKHGNTTEEGTLYLYERRVCSLC